jgi:hypothetical protein
MHKPALCLFRGTKIVIFPELNNINASLLRLTLKCNANWLPACLFYTRN